jgi:hypothetical protein
LGCFDHRGANIWEGEKNSISIG